MKRRNLLRPVEDLNAIARPGYPERIAVHSMLGRLTVKSKQGRTLRAFHLRDAVWWLYKLPRLIELLELLLDSAGSVAERQEARDFVAEAQERGLIPTQLHQQAAE